MLAQKVLLGVKIDLDEYRTPEAWLTSQRVERRFLCAARWTPGSMNVDHDDLPGGLGAGKLSSIILRPRGRGSDDGSGHQ